MNPAAIFVLMLGIGIPLTFIKRCRQQRLSGLSFILQGQAQNFADHAVGGIAACFWQLRFTTLLRIARSGSHGLDLCYENHCLSDPWSNADFAEFGRKDFV